MDQLKQVMRVLIQHRFWVLSGVITLIAVVIWIMSTSALDAEFQAQKGKIEGQYSKVNQVLGVVNHPNDFSHKRMDEINAGTRDRVYQAWTAQWERQLAVLTWPTELALKGRRATRANCPPDPVFREVSTRLWATKPFTSWCRPSASLAVPWITTRPGE